MKAYRSYNIENLIPFDQMPPDQHKELSSKGGKASGEAKRRKKALRESAMKAMERHALAEGFIDDLNEYEKWKRRRDRAREKRQRTSKNQ